jgi:hypothetical protein
MGTLYAPQFNTVFINYPHLKGTVPRDFLLLVCFMNQFPPNPLSIPLVSFRIFSKIRGDCRCRWINGYWITKDVFNFG